MTRTMTTRSVITGRSAGARRTLLRQRKGLTLLELLLVIFILSLVALSAVSLTNFADEQIRFDENRTRLAEIRRAVIGNPDRTVNGEPAVSGFVADVGRLPNTLDELVQQPPGVPTWHYEPAVGQWSGWRGPYLPTVIEQSTGIKAYRDGWGTPSDPSITPYDPNFGWKYFVPNDPLHGVGTLTVQSFGSDGTADAFSTDDSPFALDYPPRIDPLDATSPPEPIVQQADHHGDLQGWTVTVELVNQTAADWPTSDETLRLRVHAPVDGSFAWISATAWPADETSRDAAAYLSLAFDVTSADAIAPGATLTRDVSFGTTSKPVPCGVRTLQLVRDADGTPPDEATAVKRLLIVPRTQLPSKLVWELRTP